MKLEKIKLETGYGYKWGEKLVLKEHHPHNHTYYMIWGEDGQLERIALAGLYEVRLYLTGQDRTVGSTP